MQRLNLPEYPFKIRSADGRTEIFDQARRRYIALTPEEWVRQHFLMYLHADLGYPLSLIAVEKSIRVNDLQRRFDIAVHDRSGSPVILVECKSPDVELTQAVLDQAGRYNLALNVPYLVITNGMKHLCFKIDKANSSWQRLDRMPGVGEL